MSNYYCKKGCWQSADLICQNCLLKEIPASKMIEELISRKLAIVQESVEEGKRKVQGYYLWRKDVEEEKPGGHHA